MTLFDYRLKELLIYRNLLENDVVKKLQQLVAESTSEQAYDVAGELISWAEEKGISGNLAENYLIYEIGRSETIFSVMAEKYNGKVGEGLFKSALHDIAILKQIINRGFKNILPDIVTEYYQSSKVFDDTVISDLKNLFTEEHTEEEIVKGLLKHYVRYGYGDLASYKAFRWDSAQGLVGVKYVDTISLDDIIGYETQKEELIQNTESFLAGRPSNNVLLVGSRGTGKSSSIKALGNRYFKDGLRLVEVSKSNFEDLPKIMNSLRKLGKKFILFLDDLSFEEFEIEYKHLKSTIDGSIQARPDNVLLYATSNRRHLIKETWDERTGNDVHRQDALNEKISLSDRFGITIYYPSPTQDEYFEIIEGLSRRKNIDVSNVNLREEALKWEMRHSGRSGRVAQQFISYLAGK